MNSRKYQLKTPEFMSPGTFHKDSPNLYVCLGIGSGPTGFAAPLRFNALDSQPDRSNMGPVPTDVHEFCDWQKSCRGFLTRYLSCFRSGCFQIRSFEGFGRNQKDARQKVMQIRGGITSGSALFDLFVAI